MPTQNPTSTAWPADRLRAIAEADDLHVAPLREDGRTPGTPTWIWNVAVDGGLYVRAYHGPASRWYQAAVRERGGQITAAGRTDDVAFEPVNESASGALGDRIDEAYRAKYADSPYLAPMVGERARAATVEVSPRATE